MKKYAVSTLAIIVVALVVALLYYPHYPRGKVGHSIPAWKWITVPGIGSCVDIGAVAVGGLPIVKTVGIASVVGWNKEERPCLTFWTDLESRSVSITVDLFKEWGWMEERFQITSTKLDQSVLCVNGGDLPPDSQKKAFLFRFLSPPGLTTNAVNIRIRVVATPDGRCEKQQNETDRQTNIDPQTISL